MRVLFVMDPVDTVIVDEDTSFSLMIAAQHRGHRVDHCLVQDVFLRDGCVLAEVRPAAMKRDPSRPITLGEPETLDLGTVDAVFIRKDPPFDASYLWLTLMLERVRGQTLVVNDPRGLRDANEKLYACHFPEFTPDTLVSASAARIKAFTEDVGGKAVIKPVDGHGGEGIFVLEQGHLNQNAMIETVTQHGRRAAMVQRFLPEVSIGDKRILLLEGEPLGAILRVPQGGDARSNIHVGGKVAPAEITETERAMIAAMAPRLKADGLYFVGLDVIGDRLTEVNVTSPTGIQQAERFSGEPLSERVIAWTEEHLLS